MGLSVTSMKIVGGKRPSFDYEWRPELNFNRMTRFCLVFNQGIEGMQKKLTDNQLVTAIGEVRIKALSSAFDGKLPDDQRFHHESKRLALTAYKTWTGKGTDDIGELRSESARVWDRLVSNCRMENNSIVISIPNMTLNWDSFTVDLDPALKISIQRAICGEFGKNLAELSPGRAEKGALKEAIENAREKALRRVFCGDEVKDRRIEDFSDRLAVIALALRLGHKVSTYEEAVKATGLKYLREPHKKVTVNGTPEENVARAQFAMQLPRKNPLEIANRAGDKIFTKDNPLTLEALRMETKPLKKGQTPTQYTFLNGETGELLGVGVPRRINSNSCIFLPAGTKSERAGNYYSTPLIVREIKPDEGLKNLKSTGKTVKLSPKPKEDHIRKAMENFPEGDSLKVTVDGDKPVTGKYLDYHVSYSKDLIIWFQNGECLKVGRIDAVDIEQLC